MQDIVIKVVDGSEEFIGITLRLVKKQNGKNYICKETGLEIIDKWGEIESLSRYINSHNFKIKFDVLLFIDTYEGHPLFINRIQQTSIKHESKISKKAILLFLKSLKPKYFMFNFD